MAAVQVHGARLTVGSPRLEPSSVLPSPDPASFGDRRLFWRGSLREACLREPLGLQSPTALPPAPCHRAHVFICPVTGGVGGGFCRLLHHLQPPLPFVITSMFWDA